MGSPTGRNAGDLTESEVFERFFKEKALRLSRLMDEAHIRFDEIECIVEKMAQVKKTDDGFGKIIIEVMNNGGRESIRIRTILDKVIRLLPVERDL